MSQAGAPAGDGRLHEATADVVRGFRDHGYYGSEVATLRALRRRRPGYERLSYRKLFELYDRLFARAVELLSDPALLRVQADRRRRFASYEDVDVKMYRRRLKSEFPRARSRAIQQLVDWIIYWHYLR